MICLDQVIGLTALPQPYARTMLIDLSIHQTLGAVPIVCRLPDSRRLQRRMPLASLNGLNHGN